MVEVIENFLDMCAEFINKIFLFEVDFDGSFVPIGKIVLAFLFVVLTIYFVLDALGINNDVGEWFYGIYL